MLEIYLKKKDYPSSYSVLEVLRLQKKVLTNYVDQETVKNFLLVFFIIFLKLFLDKYYSNCCWEKRKHFYLS